MKKRTIVFIALIIGFIYLVIRYLPIVWFLFFTQRGDGELRTEEIKLFNEIKSKYKTSKIERTPEYDISNPKDTVTYSLFLHNVDCANQNNEQLNASFILLATKMNKELNLNDKFYKYDFVIYCKNSSVRYEFKYLRKDLK
jgi:hypothetical protein